MRGKGALLELFRRFVRPGWRADMVAAFFSGGLRCIAPRKKVALENLRQAYP